MILLYECIICCVIFGIAIVGSVLLKKEFWLQDYAPAVQERYKELHPDYKPTEKKREIVNLVVKKILVCIIFIGILLFMVWLAGAKNFLTGFLYCYIIWFAVNLFDVVVLDIGILAHWKKVRLPGTEYMDQEYRSNYKKCVIDGFYGMVIGLVVSVIVGGLVVLFTRIF